MCVWPNGVPRSSSQSAQVNGNSWPALKVARPSAETGIFTSRLQPPVTVCVATVSAVISVPW